MTAISSPSGGFAEVGRIILNPPRRVRDNAPYPKARTGDSAPEIFCIPNLATVKTTTVGHVEPALVRAAQRHPVGPFAPPRIDDPGDEAVAVGDFQPRLRRKHRPAVDADREAAARRAGRLVAGANQWEKRSAIREPAVRQNGEQVRAQPNRVTMSCD